MEIIDLGIVKKYSYALTGVKANAIYQRVKKYLKRLESGRPLPRGVSHEAKERGEGNPIVCFEFTVGENRVKVACIDGQYFFIDNRIATMNPIPEPASVTKSKPKGGVDLNRIW